MNLEEIKDQYFKEIGYRDSSNAVMEIAIGRSKIGSATILESHFEMIARRYAKEQNKDLLEWKESMMKVHNDLNLQEIGKLLGIKIGSNISPKVLPKINELINRNKELIDLLKDILRCQGSENRLSAEMNDEIKFLLIKHK